VDSFIDIEICAKLEVYLIPNESLDASELVAPFDAL